MKRFHVHVSVDDLAAGIRFYSALFAAQPAVVKDDYAKWTLEEPRLNFAISCRGGRPGVDHLGLQTDSDAELEQLNARLQTAELATRAEQEIACCYARSNKYWVTDPAGVAWETFHTLGTVPTFGEPATEAADACCAPAAAAPVRVVVAKSPSPDCCR